MKGGEDGPGDSAPSQEQEEPGRAEEFGRPLAEPVRTRVVEYGADVLGGLPESEVPAVLRRVARFEPRRRARLAGPQIAAQLESDEKFRAQVAARMERVWPQLVEELRRGTVPPAADPATVAAAAYVVRPKGWPRILERIHAELDRQEAAREAEVSAETITSLDKQLKQARSEHRAELERMRSELRSSHSTIADLRRRMNAERQRADKNAARAEDAEQRAAEYHSITESRISRYETENRKLRNRLTEVEAQVENARRAARAGRSAEEARLRVLVDVLMDAAHGLRRELALPAGIERPADLVEEGAAAGETRPPEVGLPDDDPGLIDRLLALPQIHVLVDGYNVTKSGYATLPLADQRARLLAGLDGLAARTKAEITCVFDGAEVEGRGAFPVGTRRVRPVFSDPGESADSRIIRLVRAEPSGRPLAVVSSDKEIISAVRRAGARPVPAVLLLRRLESFG